jgi:hypothetical protein
LIPGLSMGDGSDSDGGVAGITLHGEDDGARSILRAILAPVLLFRASKICVTNNQAGSWFRQRHRRL